MEVSDEGQHFGSDGATDSARVKADNEQIEENLHPEGWDEESHGKEAEPNDELIQQAHSRNQDANKYVADMR